MGLFPVRSFHLPEVNFGQWVDLPCVTIAALSACINQQALCGNRYSIGQAIFTQPIIMHVSIYQLLFTGYLLPSIYIGPMGESSKFPKS